MSYEDRVPPQDRLAEEALLGAMLLSKDAIGDAVEVVTARDFYLPAHEDLFDVITDMYATGEAIDVVTVTDAVRARGLLAKFDGGLGILALVEKAPLTADATHYAQIVAAMATRRRYITVSTKIAQAAYSPDVDEERLVDLAQVEVMDAMPQRKASEYHQINDLLAETLDAAEAAATTGVINGIGTGFYDLDDLLGGFKPGQMVVVAGRPAMGKSTLALDFLRASAIRYREPSALFSLEMTRQEVTQRVISAEAKVPLSKVRSGQLSDDDWKRIAVASNPLSQAPLYVDDTASITMTEIRAKARKLKMSVGLSLIAIDYLQLMTSGKRVESRQTEVSEFSRQIKLLAKELEVPVIALSQLNRGPEQRTSKRPMMSDLRESGSIEQDADIVILLHREDAYELESTRPGEADLIVAKHRNGATRDIAVAAQLHYSRFADLAV